MAYNVVYCSHVTKCKGQLSNLLGRERHSIATKKNIYLRSCTLVYPGHNIGGGRYLRLGGGTNDGN